MSIAMVYFCISIFRLAMWSFIGSCDDDTFNDWKYQSNDWKNLLASPSDAQENDLFRKHDKFDQSSVCDKLQECYEKCLLLTKQILVEEDDENETGGHIFDEYDNDEISDVFTRLGNVHVLKHNCKDALACFGEGELLMRFICFKDHVKN